MSYNIGDRIKQLRLKLHLTQEGIAELLGLNRVSYSHYETNKNLPPSDKLSLLVDILQTNADYLLGKTDDPTPAKIKYDQPIGRNIHTVAETVSEYKTNSGIPLVGSICAGNGLLANENIESHVYYPFQNSKRKPDYALRVNGNSMKDVGIKDGDVVFLQKASWAEYNGQIVAAIINGEEGMLKRIKWFEGSPKVHLIPENDEFPIIEAWPNEITICGVYLGHFTELDN